MQKTLSNLSRSLKIDAGGFANPGLNLTHLSNPKALIEKSGK